MTITHTLPRYRINASRYLNKGLAVAFSRRAAAVPGVTGAGVAAGPWRVLPRLASLPDRFAFNFVGRRTRNLV